MKLQSFQYLFIAVIDYNIELEITEEPVKWTFTSWETCLI